MASSQTEASVRREAGERRQLVPLSVESTDSESVDVTTLLRKLHRRVLPIALTILFFGNIDRGNLGFVANQLCRDLNLTHTEYGTGASAFFMGYLFSRIPSNIALRYFGGPLWLMIIMFTWGVAAASMALMNSVYQFYILRLLLGLAEGGAFPSVWYYITGFYPDEHLSFAYSMLAAAAPVATACAGPIAAAFFSVDGIFGIKAWRLLFFCEGFVPAVLAFFMYFIIPKSIDKSPFLTREERDWLHQRLKLVPSERERTYCQELMVLLKSVPFWIINIFGIVHLALFAVITYWTTLMIEEAATSDEDKDQRTCASSHSTALSAIIITGFVFVLASLSTLLLGVFYEKGTNRSAVSGWITALCGVALASWALTQRIDDDLGLISLTIAACAMNAPLGLFVGLLVSFYDQQIKATALSVYSTIVTIGAIVGPIMTGAIVDHYGNYDVASVILGAFGVAGGMLLLIVRDPLRDKKWQEIVNDD